MIKKHLTFFLVVTALLFTVACGGDDEDDTDIINGPDSDTTPPTFVSVSPTQVENVPVNTSVTLTFSEPMDVSTFVQGTTFTFTGGQPSGNVPITVSASGNDIILNPTNNLRGGGAEYSYQVFPGNITDLAGNALDANTIEGTFTTLNTPLEITNISPRSGEAGISLNPSIVITFSKTLDPNLVSEAAFFFQEGSGPEVNTSFSVSGNKVTLVPTVELKEFATSYRTAIEGGLVGTQVRAMDGNYLAEDYDSYFNTVVVSENYYYIIDGNGGPYLALEERSTTRPNGYRNLDLIVSLNTSKSLWRPVKSSYQGRTAYGFVNKLDDDNDFYGKDNPQFLYGISPDDGQAEIYSNRPPNTSTGFYANQLWELIGEGTANGDSWFLYNPATQSYLEPGNTPPDAITNQSATDDWFLRRRSTYSGN